MKKLVVLGGGISGYGSAILAKKMGYELLLSDKGMLAPKYVEILNKYGVEFEQGGHSVERIMEAHEVVKSPGIPDKVEIIMQLKERGIPVISEIEFAGRYLDGARTICITGSNGKTTTTSLIYKILCDAGVSVSLGGNIGESFAFSVAESRADWYVLEISSFQLDGMFEFKADVAVLMNITPDHLDRYDYKFENYAASKMRVAQNQTPTDSFIYSADDEEIISMMDRVGATQLPFSKGDITADGLIKIEAAGKSLMIDANKMQIKGLHNCYNAMAAAKAAMAAGVDEEQILKSIYEFNPVEHRLEPAGAIDGVEYINDSKATNVDSVWYALDSMTRPTVWIAGGTDKGNDYAPIVELARNKVHTLICMGLDNAALEHAFGPIVPKVISTSSLEEAMVAARTAAHEGDTVLLSPACASFDLFKNYEDRGRQFKGWVAKNME
ncbi:MAG: UDP-N-acetylmuramoyl-L-alanine--D-glutamate ligase [Rikenellaceae bacterium]